MKNRFILILFSLTSMLAARQFPFTPDQWRLAENASFIAGELVFQSASATNISVRQNTFHLVEPGTGYTLELAFKDEITGGSAWVEIRMFNGYDGTSQSIQNTELVSMLSSRRIAGELKSQPRILRCNFTVPANVTGINIRICADNFKGQVTFYDLKLSPGDGTFALPLLKQAPPLNGELDPDFASKALRCVDFMVLPLHDDTLAADKTEAYLASTHDKLLATFLLYHNPQMPLNARELSRDDRSLWRDDSIEFYITHTGADIPLYLFMVNTQGCIYDSINAQPDWNGSIRTAVGRQGKDCTVIQIEIDLPGIGYSAQDINVVDAKWKFNIKRNHGPNATRKDTIQSTFAPAKVFNETENFVPLRGMEPAKGTVISAKFIKNMPLTVRADKKTRTWPVSDPLYQELISDTPQPFPGKSAIVWFHPLDDFNLQFALQYGKVYSRQIFLDEFARHRLNPFVIYDTHLAWVAEWGRSTGLGAVLHSPFWVGDYTFPYNDKAYQDQLDKVESLLKENPGSIQMVTIGDEVLYRWVSVMIERAANPDYANRPDFKAAVQAIKRDYGFGKYGLPSSLNASDEPFNFLATRNWLLARMLAFQKDLWKLCKQYKGSDGGEILVLSEDPIGYGLIQHQSRFAPYTDIMTMQTALGNHPERQAVAFATKVIRDISDKPVWPCLHVEPYLGHYSNAEITQAYSEAARCGASGFQFYPPDVYGRVNKTGSTRCDYYGHRPRWDAIMSFADRFRSMNSLKFPEADYAYFLSNDTSLSQARYDLTPCEVLFNYAGPGAGSWFKFITDIQLLDGRRKLSDWPVILVASAGIQCKDVAVKFREYVRNGGILICFDPQIFSYGANGTDTSALREDIFGVKAGKHSGGLTAITLKNTALFQNDETTKLPVFESNFILEPQAGVKTLGVYDNGLTAISQKDYPGGGKAIMFSFNIGKQMNLPSQKKWHDFFRTVLNNLGLKTGLDIWRFTFPQYPEGQAPVFKNKCLTGNNFYWWDSVPQVIANVTLPEAKYAFTLAPDSDQSGQLTHSFKDGNLTNRLSSWKVPDLWNPDNKALIESGKLNLGLFADTWTKTDAFEVKFDFGQPVTVETLKIFFHGELPEFRVSCDDGRSFVPGKGESTEWLAESVLEPGGQTTSSLLLRFGPRRPGNKIILSEIEIWGGVPASRK